MQMMTVKTKKMMQWLLLGTYMFSFVFTPSIAKAELGLSSVVPNQGAMFQPLPVKINGQGFDVKTRVMMTLDGWKPNSIVGSSVTSEEARSVTVSGHMAYVAVGGRGMEIYDISEPARPKRLTTVDTPGYAQAVSVASNMAYVADLHSLQVIDVTIPTRAHIIGKKDISGKVNDVSVLGNTAYVAVGGKGLQLFNVTNPSTPQYLVTAITQGDTWAVSVNDSGTYAFVADGRNGLQVVDVRNLGAPVLGRKLSTPDLAYDVMVVGETAYVAIGAKGMMICDVASPQSPQQIGMIDTPGEARGIRVVGNQAFVADSSSGLQIIDVSKPTEPKLLATVDTPGSGLGVDANDDGTALIADGGKGLQVIKVPPSSHFIGAAETSDWASFITIVGQYAYVTNTKGLEILDISNPAKPLMVGKQIDSPGQTHGVAISGENAVVANGMYGLQIIDIADPKKPATLVTLETPGEAKDVVIGIVDKTRPLAYVADSFSGLQIVDLSDPSSPFIIGESDTPGIANGVAVRENYAYVADWDALRVIEVTDPTDPKVVGSVRIDGTVEGVALIGNYALVAAGDIGLLCVDISIPTNPTIVGRPFATTGAAKRVSVDKDLAYVVDSDALWVVNVSDLPSMQKVTSLVTPGVASAVAVNASDGYGNLIYVADGSSGVQVIKAARQVSAGVIGGMDIAVGSAEGVFVEKARHLVLVASLQGDLQIVSLLDPVNPNIIGSASTPGFARAVAAFGNYAFVADGGAGVQAIDISNPSNPLLVGNEIDTTGRALDIAIASGGTWAVVANIDAKKSPGLDILDIRVPDSMQIMRSVITVGGVGNVVVNSDNIVAAAEGADGVELFDCNNLANPQKIGHIDTPAPRSARGVEFKDKFVLVADGYNLLVYDITDPAIPRMVKELPCSGATGVTIDGNLALVASSTNGLSIYDITDPRNTKWIKTVDTIGKAVDVAVYGSFACVADGYRGISLIPLPQEVTSLTVNSPSNIDLTLPPPQVPGNYSLMVINQNSDFSLAGGVNFSGMVGSAMAIGKGWNLLSSFMAIDVSESFGDPTKFVSVWAWRGNNWAVYLSDVGALGELYATSKGFTVLDKVRSGEGFWINSMVAIQVTRSSSPEIGALMINSGWSLVGLKALYPMSVAKLTAGQESRINSLWKWQNDKWVVAIPNDEDDGKGYATSKGFDFLTYISPNEGFWINAKQGLTLGTD